MGPSKRRIIYWEKVHDHVAPIKPAVKKAPVVSAALHIFSRVFVGAMQGVGVL
jgi:hypothetical protein